MQDTSYAPSPAPWSASGYAAPPPRRPPQRHQPFRDDGQYRAPSTREGFGEPHGREAGPPRRSGVYAPPRAPRARPQAEMFSITCNACGIQAEVPFKPAEGRDVFCQACYRARKPA
jgi:CxxC-x17-CxxC domain-containing protein